MMYEQRLCAFVDVLGFRELIERSLKQPHLQQQVRHLLREVTDAKPIWERDSPVDIIEARLRKQGIPNPRSEAEQKVARYADAERGTSFSDSLVLSATLNDHAISSLVTSLLFLSRGAAELGHYVRGGVCKGLLCHEEDLCFGPALIAAYDLEQKIAFYPRIVVSPDAHDAIATVGMDVVGPLSSYIRTDFDGERFLHFLSPQAMELVGSFRDEQMREIHRELSRQLSCVRPGNHSRPKLIWLARYFNSVLEEAPISGMESLSIEIKKM
jgi:hypothetical protein